MRSTSATMAGSARNDGGQTWNVALAAGDAPRMQPVVH